MGTFVLDSALRAGTEKTVMLGTICSYPKHTPVPFSENSLWEGYPEEVNRAYGFNYGMESVADIRRLAQDLELANALEQEEELGRESVRARVLVETREERIVRRRLENLLQWHHLRHYLIHRQHSVFHQFQDRGKRVFAVERAEYLDYGSSRTHDILPEGETGLYWAGGIKMGSTLKAPAEMAGVGTELKK